MDDMQNIPYRMKSFKDLIINHDRMTINSNISISMFDRRTQKRYYRINNLMKKYYDCTDDNKLLMYSKILTETKYSIWSLINKLKMMEFVL